MPPPIFGLGTAGGYELHLQNRGEGGAKRLNEVAQQFLGRAQQPTSRWRSRRRSGAPTCRSSSVDVDREKAKKVGVPINDVFNALSATLGNYYVNDFNKYGRAWQVLMSADPVVPQPARRHRRRLRALATAATWSR